MPKGGPDSRFFLIFEARVDNTSPQKSGFEGCRAVVNFWRDLSDENDASKRATRLEEFYYKGAPGVSGPVVQAKNYGGPLGQVRGNLFMNSSTFFRWQLREWIVINSGTPTPASFTPVTVKENPLAEYYRDTTGPDTIDVPLETAERTEFQTQFKNNFLKRLVEPDVLRQFLTAGQTGYVAELDPKNPSFDPGKYKNDILNRFGARFDNRFNEFQSVSQGPEDDPKAIADTSGPVFKAGASGALNAFVIDAPQKPTIDDVLNWCGSYHVRRLPSVLGQPPGRIGKRSAHDVASKCWFRTCDRERRALACPDRRPPAVPSEWFAGSRLHSSLPRSSRRCGGGERASLKRSGKCAARVLAATRC